MRRPGAAPSGAPTFRRESDGASPCRQSEVHPAQVAGMFYPAEPDALNALSRTRASGRVRTAASRRRSSSRRMPASSIRARSPRPRSARGRAAPSRRDAIVIIGPAHRVAFRGIAIHPAAKWRTPLGEAPVAAVAHAELAKARAVFVDPRPFAGEHSLEMHLVMLQAMLPAPFEIVPILIGDADPHHVAEALRVVWGGPETVVAVSSDLSHFLDREAPKRSTPIPPGASRRLTRHRSKGAGPAASCRSKARSKSPPSATCGRAACILRLRLTLAPMRRASSAMAPSRSNTPPPRGFKTPIASCCFRPAWPHSGKRRERRQAAGAGPERHVACAFALARDLRHADRERRAARLHRLARAATAPRRRCDRQHGAGGFRRSPLSAAQGERPRRASHRRLDFLAPAANCRGQRSAARGRARARSRWPHSRRRQASRALPAERLASASGRARVRASSDRQGRSRNDKLAGGARSFALPRRVVRRPWRRVDAAELSTARKTARALH